MPDIQISPTDRFAIRQGWKITWCNPHVPPMVPLQKEGTLLIGIANKARSKCNVAWLDPDGSWCSIARLPYREGDDDLGQNPIAVRHGTRRPQKLAVRLWFEDQDSQTLHGSITDGVVTGDAGAFTAEAHPSGEEHNGAE